MTLAYRLQIHVKLQSRLLRINAYEIQIILKILFSENCKLLSPGQFVCIVWGFVTCTTIRQYSTVFCFLSFFSLCFLFLFFSLCCLLVFIKSQLYLSFFLTLSYLFFFTRYFLWLLFQLSDLYIIIFDLNQSFTYLGLFQYNVTKVMLFGFVLNFKILIMSQFQNRQYLHLS